MLGISVNLTNHASNNDLINLNLIAQPTQALRVNLQTPFMRHDYHQGLLSTTSRPFFFLSRQISLHIHQVHLQIIPSSTQRDCYDRETILPPSLRAFHIIDDDLMTSIIRKARRGGW